jgi:hypothetical protein
MWNVTPVVTRILEVADAAVVYDIVTVSFGLGNWHNYHNISFFISLLFKK